MKLISALVASALMVSAPAFASKEIASKNACMGCHAVDKKFLSLRQKLINEMFQGKACIDAYNLIYPGTYAELFDPLTSEQTPSVVCTQIVNEVEALLAAADANEVNSLRYSYLVS